MTPGEVVDAIERGPNSDETWEKVLVVEDLKTYLLIKRNGQLHAVPKRCIRERTI